MTAFIGAVAFIACAGAHAQFSGPFAPENWIFNANGGTGSVDTSQAPASITIIGHDGFILYSHLTTFEYVVNSGGICSFDWRFMTADPGWEDCGALLNGVYTLLSNTPEEQGSLQIAVSKGDRIGFGTRTVDGIVGPGMIEISNFRLLCRGDLNHDGIVGSADLLLIMNEWGTMNASSADLDGDGVVGSSDLAELLAAWGPCGA